MSYPVKYLHHAMRGAPQISGQSGTLLAALRAFLFSGWGQVAAQSVTVAGGIATATVNPGDTFEAGTVIDIAGASPSELNGSARVLSATNTQVTWATPAADGAASGSITLKYAPVGGWEEPWPSDPHTSALRSAHPLAGGMCLRVDDSAATFCAVQGYESMTDVDTGTGPFPTPAQAALGAWWAKSAQANATSVPYWLAADSAMLLCAIAIGAGQNPQNLGAVLRGFGLPLALHPAGDAWATLLSCAIYGNKTTGQNFPFNGSLDHSAASANYGQIFCARPHGGLSSSQAQKNIPLVGNVNAFSGADATLGPFPGAVDGQMKFARRLLCSSADNTPRAALPAVLHIAQSGVLNHIAPGDRVAGSGALAGRTLLALASSNNPNHSNQAAQGIYLLDITGPWR